MKKIIFSFALLLSALILTGCGKKSEVTDPTGEGMTTQTEDVSNNEIGQEKFTSTMTEVLKRGGKATCTISMNNEGMEFGGTFYIDGKKNKSVFSSSAGGMTIEMHSLSKDGYSYSWNSMSKQGTKIAIPETDESVDASDVEESDVDTSGLGDAQISFDCKKGVDGSASFDIPGDITFKEVNY